jgi:hypothetical protein
MPSWCAHCLHLSSPERCVRPEPTGIAPTRCRSPPAAGTRRGTFHPTTPAAAAGWSGLARAGLTGRRTAQLLLDGLVESRGFESAIKIGNVCRVLTHDLFKPLERLIEQWIKRLRSGLKGLQLLCEFLRGLVPIISTSPIPRRNSRDVKPAPLREQPSNVVRALTVNRLPQERMR